MLLINKACCCLITILSLNSAKLFVDAVLPNLNARQLTPHPRADAVKSAFKFAWDGYSKYAYGHDELLSKSNGFSDSRNAWGASIFDALDTLIIMGMDNEYNKALKFVENVNWAVTNNASKTFETTIRYLGGLMSAYDLRPNPMLLRKAVDLTNQALLPAFNTPNGVPAPFVNPIKKTPHESDNVVLAEFALQMEFVRLSQLTGNPLYAKLANNVIEKVSKVSTPLPGLYTTAWNAKKFTPGRIYITVSGGGDSFYEYLLKTHILMSGAEDLQLKMWERSVDSMYKYLRNVANDGSVYLSENINGYRFLQSGELVCFMPGNLILGARYLNNKGYEQFAKELMDSCYKTWANSPTGIAPERWGWIDDSPIGNLSSKLYSVAQIRDFERIGFIPTDNRYLLRPETVESLFYFYRLTGETKYQDMAWEIFKSIEKYCKTSSGYASIENVFSTTAAKSNFQESYFLAETLKYLYLIFSDPSLISLDEYIFNTEAHPFKLRKPIKVQK